MIVAAEYRGDSHEHVMLMQHRVYEQVIAGWVGRLMHVFAKAEALTGSGSILAMQIQHCHRFDHRTVQGAHDLVAAAFRWRYTPTTPLFAGVGLNEDFEARWRGFARQEFEAFLLQPRTAALWATAVARGNTPAGLAAEREIDEQLRDWYHDVPWRDRAEG